MNSTHISVRLSRSLLIGLAVASAAMASGCGSNAKVESRSTTVGQELQDLDEARNKGLLTEDEYSKKRAEIMKRK